MSKPDTYDFYGTYNFHSQTNTQEGRAAMISVNFSGKQDRLIVGKVKDTNLPGNPVRRVFGKHSLEGDAICFIEFPNISTKDYPIACSLKRVEYVKKDEKSEDCEGLWEGAWSPITEYHVFNRLGDIPMQQKIYSTIEYHKYILTSLNNYLTSDKLNQLRESGEKRNNSCRVFLSK